MKFLPVPIPTPHTFINTDAIAYVTSNAYEVGELRANEAKVEVVVHFVGGTQLEIKGKDAVAFLGELFYSGKRSVAPDNSAGEPL